MITLDFGPYNYNVHRKAQVRLIEAFTTSKKSTTTEIVIHFLGDYDERYEAGSHITNIPKVLKRMMKDQGATYKCYLVPDKKLRKYNTTKSEASKGKYCRPDIKWLVPEVELVSVVTYDDVESPYKPTNDIARDFEEHRVPIQENEELEDEFFGAEEETKD